MRGGKSEYTNKRSVVRDGNGNPVKTGTGGVATSNDYSSNAPKSSAKPKAKSAPKKAAKTSRKATPAKKSTKASKAPSTASQGPKSRPNNSPKSKASSGGPSKRPNNAPKSKPASSGPSTRQSNKPKPKAKAKKSIWNRAIKGGGTTSAKPTGRTVKRTRRGGNR